MRKEKAGEGEMGEMEENGKTRKEKGRRRGRQKGKEEEGDEKVKGGRRTGRGTGKENRAELTSILQC